jgi:hypothetical protein
MTKARDAVEDVIRGLGPHKGLRLGVGDSDVAADCLLQLSRAAVDASTELFSVSAANQRSTRLIHEAPVGVKCRWKRGWRASQRWIAGVLCVLELSRIKWTTKRGGTRVLRSSA